MARFLPYLSFLVLAVWIHLSGARQGDALTIYRIGGENLDPPALVGSAGIDFVPLAWKDLDSNLFGSAEQLELGADFIAPVRLDPDVNLTPLIDALGGAVLSTGYGKPHGEPQTDLLRDGDPETAYRGDDGAGYYHLLIRGTPYKFLQFDLGAPLNLRRVRLSTRSGRRALDSYIPRFIMATNDGDIRKHGSREARAYLQLGFVDFDVLYDVSENTNAFLDLEIPPGPVRKIIFYAPIGPWEIAEFEIYGDGFVPQARYVSNIVDLGEPGVLGNLTWSARADAGASMSLKVRSGADDDPNFYWRYTFRGGERTRFDADGLDLTRAAYNLLEGGEKAGLSPDTENWQPWETVPDYSLGGFEPTSPHPPRFVQFAAEFLSSRGEGGGRLDFLQFGVTQPPFASQVQAEITPVRVELGEPVRFTCKIRPVILGRDRGFDSVVIEAPVAPGSVDAARIGNADLTQAAFRGEVAEGEFAVGPYENGRFAVRLPRMDLNQSGELIEIEFWNEVFTVGTSFSVSLFDSSEPDEVPQRAVPGDVDPGNDSNSLSVRPEKVEVKALHELRLSPPVFTPNGDGINDLLIVEYDLVNLAGAVPVVLAFHDLSGRQVREISAVGTSGRFAATWNGRDAGNRLLSPGTYFLRVNVEADRRQETAVAAVRLAY